MRRIDSCLYEEDIIKYYELRNRQSDASPNIGVVGDRKTFRNKMKRILESTGLKNRRTDGVFMVDNGNRITIIVNDIETTYIHIETMHDLIGRYFRSYM